MWEGIRKSEIDKIAKAEQGILGKTIKGMKSASKGTLDITFVEGGIMRLYGGCEQLNDMEAPSISAYYVAEYQKPAKLRKEIEDIDEELIRLKEARYEREKTLDIIDDIEKRPSGSVKEMKKKRGRSKKKEASAKTGLQFSENAAKAADKLGLGVSIVEEHLKNENSCTIAHKNKDYVFYIKRTQKSKKPIVSVQVRKQKK